uniref:Neurogenic locus notch 2 n=1 Tax=Sipha flava TaxID=143950 RepID=A0A2S2QFK9_9HEMI
MIYNVYIYIHKCEIYKKCIEIIAVQPTPTSPADPCYPSPCGPNARCHVENQNAICECLPEYQGNPYESCRPECLVSSDCAMNKACIRNKCQDPCPGTCGISAICFVSNHIPICSCPEHLTGDPFQICQPIPARDPIPSNPCVPSPCGPNTRCRIMNGAAICECLQGYEGSPSTSGCRPECVISPDCPRNKACVNNKCVDPCPGVCGYEAICQTINHSPVCSCPPPTIGDPFVECKQQPALPSDPCNPSPCGSNGQCRVIGKVASCVYPECIINQDCPRDKACFTQKCQDPCRDVCGLNAICQVVNHNAICSCPPGYYGEPKQQCIIQRSPEPKPECTTDSECSNDKTCINYACKNPCQESPTTCARNALCYVQKHRSVCVCKDGMTGNAQILCIEIGCRADTDCPPEKSCVNGDCVDPCAYTHCGINALCRTDGYHRARCYCPPAYEGDPFVECRRPECTIDSDCPSTLACRNQHCQSPCDCAPTALCNVANHIAACRCPPGYIGNPHISCTLTPLDIPPQCSMDSDCASKLACFNGDCRNPCKEIKPCGANAECTVVDTLPHRTMSCQCIPGYVGDADVQCKLGVPTSVGCSSNSDCQPTDSCLNRQCVNPCTVSNPCASTALCTINNHKAVCRCPDGLTGDPFISCYKVPLATPECTTDSECPSSKICSNQYCQDPCQISKPCDITAECVTINHRPICNCPNGWAGNPQIQCYKPGCKTDSDCVYDKACINSNCLNPCSAQSCGHGAECVVQAHKPHCICPAGTQGSPMISCVSVVCQYNEDCADHEACDRLNRRCRPVCEQDTCAEQATCLAQAHQPTCTCISGFQGNPYIECIESRVPSITPECTIDSDCPSQHACINQRCQNPCTLSVLCSPDQECHVQDTVPYKTIMCQCRPDTVATIDGRCKPIVPITPQCKSDLECPSTERCVNQGCVEACRIDPCGINAQCVSLNHQSACSCPPGYTGNPHIECSLQQATPMLPPQPECMKNDDCAPEKSCVNQKCISPCTLDDSCGRGSFCHTQNHQPVCRCPNGYTGDPRIACIPPSISNVGCVSNTECSPEESCINRLCVSPCNCGPNSDCKVYNHYPSCICKPGYYGNPQQGCIKMGCTSDDQCAYDKQCYNGECVPPCLLNDPCAPTAKCYGDNHRAACQCPPGFFGNPFEKCERTECTYDIDCPSDRMCFDQHCINPCTEQHSPPCASNAICFVRNHAVSCKCPENFPMGDPNTYCERLPPPLFGEPECKIDVDCASRLACIKEKCVNPCREIKPCSDSAMCTVLDSVPVRTMTCTCSEGWVLDEGGECKQVIVSSPPGCTTNDDCPSNEACLNQQCRNPCNCGTNAQCFVQNHHPVCSCLEGYNGNPNFACRTIGCKRNSECESGKACINGHCLNPCIVEDPCGPNAECFTVASRPECRCKSGYRGNPYDRCLVIGCRSNNDCPDDRSCINGQCINPCVYEHPCSSQAQCKVQNHFALCRCPPGLVGNPYVACRQEVQPECNKDADCPSLLACFDNVCQNPCTTLEPCKRPAECVVIDSLPVRTMICECPSGYASSGSGTCKITPPMTAVACTADTQCPSDRACLNGRCIDPCNCGPNSECRVWDHKPVCSCLAGFDGSPEIDCSRAGCRSESDCSGQHTCINRICVAVCAADGSSCGTSAECYGINHQAICECPPGMVGNPQIACVVAGCRSDTDCPIDKACINTKCIDPCTKNNPCIKPAECTVYNHRTDCACPPGYIGSVETSCKKIETGCQSDSDCPSQTGCINKLCVSPCDASSPCGINSKCKVLDTYPIRTMTCECLPGTQGNAAIRCDEVSKCPIEKGYVRNENGECVCPPGTALNQEDECRRCIVELGFKIDENGRCVCALDRGLIIDERGRCICPTEHGYSLNIYGQCVPKNTTQFRTDFPRPDMVVTCLSDGVQVEIHITEKGFNGVLYVKGHSKNEQCRRVVSMAQDSSPKTEIFKVNFGNCGLIHVNGQASFVLVIQKHPKLVTYKAQAYHIRCVYQTGEQNVTLGFNVSMLTTAGTIANTGPPPTCLMKIVTHTGQEINSAEIGDNLMLQVDVQPSSIYGGYARSCVAKTIEDNVENEYIVTDENGCATDPTIFGEWDYNADTQSLLAGFNAFKFPSSDNIRFQCNIRVCFGKCQPVRIRIIIIINVNLDRIIL